jgi:hypothetical protein
MGRWLTRTGYQDHKVYFNGCKQEDVDNSNRIGTHGKIISPRLGILSLII